MLQPANVLLKSSRRDGRGFTTKVGGTRALACVRYLPYVCSVHAHTWTVQRARSRGEEGSGRRAGQAACAYLGASGTAPCPQNGLANSATVAAATPALVLRARHMPPPSPLAGWRTLASWPNCKRSLHQNQLYRTDTVVLHAMPGLAPRPPPAAGGLWLRQPAQGFGARQPPHHHAGRGVRHRHAHVARDVCRGCVPSSRGRRGHEPAGKLRMGAHRRSPLVGKGTSLRP